MKKFTKILCIALASIMVLGIVFTAAACPKNYTVSFMADGKEIESVSVPKNNKVDRPKTDPKKDDFTFSHWYNDESKFSAFYDFDKVVTKDMKIFAHFANNAEDNVSVTYDFGGGKKETLILKKGTKLHMPDLADKTIKWQPEHKSGDPINADIVFSADYAAVQKGTLVMNSGDFDGVFSPFFSSSAYDGAVAGQTQIGMLSSDHEGLVEVGDHVPTVAKAYKTTTYVNGTADVDGSLGATLSDSQKKDGSTYWTEYEFLIKNDIKFSDGSDLTIKDVLFNLYLYLDPMYDGSSTMYSTAIKGLKAYRSQKPELTDDSTTDWMAVHREYADDKKLPINNYFLNTNETELISNRNYYKENVKELIMVNDVQKLREEFWKEVVNDYKTAAATPFGEPTEKHPYGDGNPYGDEMFTEPWQVFMYMYGFISVTKGDDGKVQTVVSPEEGTVYDEHTNLYKKINYKGCDEFSRDPLDLIKIAYNSVFGIEDTENDKTNELDGVAIDLKLTDTAYKAARAKVTNPTRPTADEYRNHLSLPLNDILATGTKYTYYKEKTNLAGETVIDPVCLDDPNYLIGRFRHIFYGSKMLENTRRYLTFSVAGTDLVNQWINESISDAAEKSASQGRFAVETISGVTVASTNSFVDNNGNTIALDKSHHVLKIEIIGVDPKAIWNFGFGVAPMEYYSDCTGKGTFQLARDGYENFNYPGTPGYKPDQATKLGFKQHNKKYFDDVFKNEDLIRLPMGAGAFKATDSSNRSDNPTYSEFFKDNVVYFKANNYFETTGAGVTNPKIAKLRYQVVDTTKTLDSLITGDINYGDPQAKQQSVDRVDLNKDKLAGELIENLGYGYVGINAKYVRNINIRRIIMTAMNTKTIEDYYKGGFAEIIHRPMSTVSWAYPKGQVGDYYEFKDEANLVDRINYYFNQMGTDIDRTKRPHKVLEDGKWVDLKYTFTIAGAETDHPAYQMFMDAAGLLNKYGFNINVVPDPLALSKLSAGTLHVWAAAWSSSIDPDMFQTYHMDSTASSVRAWGYPFMKENEDSFVTEMSIIRNLSRIIDQARSTLDKDKRKLDYADALDLVMDLAVEYPTYQRKNYVVYNVNDFNDRTFFKPTGPYAGHLSRIWEVEMLNS